MGARFVHLTWQGGGSHPCIPFSYASVVSSHYKNKVYYTII